MLLRRIHAVKRNRRTSTCQPGVTSLIRAGATKRIDEPRPGNCAFSLAGERGGRAQSVLLDYERGKCIRSLVPSPSGASTLKWLARCPISGRPMPKPGLSWRGRIPQP
jgi:hypothetical protein